MKFFLFEDTCTSNSSSYNWSPLVTPKQTNHFQIPLINIESPTGSSQSNHHHKGLPSFLSPLIPRRFMRRGNTLDDMTRVRDKEIENFYNEHDHYATYPKLPKISRKGISNLMRGFFLSKFLKIQLHTIALFISHSSHRISDLRPLRSPSSFAKCK